MAEQVEEGWPEEEQLRKRVLELFGSFAYVQEWLMTVVTFHFKKASPQVGEWVEERYYQRVSDPDRLRWFIAVVADSGVQGVPVDTIRDVFNEAKGIRDMIAHSPGATPMWLEQRWQLRISHMNTPKIRNRIEALPDLTNEEFLRQSARLSWVSSWITWFLAESKYVPVVDMYGDDIDVPEPPKTPPA